jgi:hypothetical protein
VPKEILPFAPPPSPSERQPLFEFQPGMDPTLSVHASKYRFFSPGPSPVNDPCANPARKNEPDRNYFSSDNPPTRLDRPDAASEPYAPCEFGLTLDRFHNLHAIQIISQYAFFHPASLDLSLSSQKKYLLRSSFVHCPDPTRSGTLCITSTHPLSPPTNPSTEWKESTSRPLCNLLVFV